MTATPEDHALVLSGLMADHVIALLGGRGLNGTVAPAHPDEFSDRAKQLRRAAEAYNDYIIELFRTTTNTP